jgi:2-polyprenyl-3-methyl-5-hydroxy-6-metoxy-1,4-benzoquinol methylase
LRFRQESGGASLQFEEEYFSDRGYTQREHLVKRHVFEVIKWAAKISDSDLFSGRGKKALDVGCACGYASEVLEALGYETYGVDVSRWGIMQAKTNSEGHFLVCDAQAKLPFKDVTFDLITCYDVLEHLRLPEKTIQSMLDVCDGVMVCTTPNKTVEKPVRKIMRDFDETHINVKSASEWKNCISKNLEYKLLKIGTFLDLTAKPTNNRLFFKSLNLPNWGLTVRILVRK